MLRHERHNRIIAALKEREAVSVPELAKMTGTSTMTIRRDLDEFEAAGIIKKVRGGAMLAKVEPGQPTFRQRSAEGASEKERIGAEAAKLVNRGDIVLFDAGTTSLAAARHIPDELEFTAITTGLMTAAVLCEKPGVSVICIGGNLHKSSLSSINHMSVDMIKRFNADKAFISTRAISLPEGAFETLLPLIEIKRAIVSISKEVILLADHTKFETKSLSLSVPLENIHTIITDSGIPASIANALRAAGKKIIIV